MTAKGDASKPKLMCFANSAGRSDVERRHRVALLLELNRLGIATQLTTLGNDDFRHIRLQNWDKLEGFQFKLNDANVLSEGILKLRSLTNQAQSDIYWGLDAISNRYALMAQKMVKGSARVVSIEHADTPKGLKERIAAKLEAGPEMTVARTLRAFRLLTGRGKERALVHISPGLDLTRIRNRATPGEVKAARKRAEFSPDGMLIAAWVKDAEAAEVARLIAVAEAANARLCLFGVPKQATQWPRDAKLMSEDDYMGYLPLIASANAFVSLGSGIEDVLARREATAVGTPVYLFDAETGVSNDAVGIFAAPVTPEETASHILSLNADKDRMLALREAAKAHAMAEYDIKAEAKRLAGLFTRTETV